MPRAAERDFASLEGEKDRFVLEQCRVSAECDELNKVMHDQQFTRTEHKIRYCKISIEQHTCRCGIRYPYISLNKLMAGMIIARRRDYHVHV